MVRSNKKPNKKKPSKWDVIKNGILGKDYDLSLAFITPKESQKINKLHRGKDKPTNVLSFSFSKKEGEILICKDVVKKESKDKNKNFGKNYSELLQFLVIHGMLHLKGMRHGSIMERAEKFYCKKYDQEYFNRHRRGILHDESRGGRIFKRRKKS